VKPSYTEEQKNKKKIPSFLGAAASTEKIKRRQKPDKIDRDGEAEIRQTPMHRWVLLFAEVKKVFKARICKGLWFCNHCIQNKKLYCNHCIQKITRKIWS